MTFLDDIKSYLRFGEEDTSILRELRPILSPHFEAFAAQFYDRLLSHCAVSEVSEAGNIPVGELRATLVSWMQRGLEGPHDESFFDSRTEMGRVHVGIGLPQQYLVTAMNMLRTAYRRVIANECANDRDRLDAATSAIERLFGLDLAIMLQAYLLDSENRLRQRERMAALGQVAASIGHDLRNPLAVIDSSTFVLRRRCGDNAKVLRHVDRIAAQVAICEGIVSNVLELASDRPLTVERVDVRTTFDEAVASVPVGDGVVIRYDVAESLSMNADKKLVARALANLIDNASNAIGKRGGTIELRADVDGGNVVLSVSDDGPGFDPAQFPTLFESAKSTVRGNVGLGLPLVKKVVERHGGRVAAENETNGGARITMALPMMASSDQSRDDDRTPSSRRRLVSPYLH